MNNIIVQTKFPPMKKPFGNGHYSLPSDPVELRSLFVKRLNRSVSYARFFMFVCLCFEKGQSPTLRQISATVNVSVHTRRVIFVTMERLGLITGTMVKVSVSNDARFHSTELVVTKGPRYDFDSLSYAVMAEETLRMCRVKSGKVWGE